MAINREIKKNGRPFAPPPPRGLLPGLAVALGLGAVAAAAACCVLPIALASLGVGAGLLGGLSSFAGWRTPLLALSAILVGGAWALRWRNRRSACDKSDACAAPRAGRGPLALLIAATAFVIVASSWRRLEPTLMNWVS